MSDNLMGAGPNRPTILALNHEGLLVSDNNLFPRGRSLIEFSGCARSSVTAGWVSDSVVRGSPFGSPPA